MKKFLAIIFWVVILTIGVFGISGCGCSKSGNEVSTTPDTELVGNWGERSDDIEVEFNDDGTCTIGGINGTYKIDDENRLTVTPNTEEGSDESAEPLIFEYYSGDGNLSSIPQNQWAISDNKLYINGYQYTKDDTDNTSSNNSPDNSSSNSSSHTSNSKPSTNNPSSSTPAESKPNNNSNTPNSTTSNSNNGSSNTENPSNSESDSSGSIQIQNGEEEDIINIYQNLDNF